MGNLRKSHGGAVTGQFVLAEISVIVKKFKEKGHFIHGNLKKGFMVLRPLIAFIPLDRIVSN